MALLHDGFSTIVTLTVDGATPVVLIEKEVHPSDEEVGEIDTTTMRSSKVRTKQPKSLITIGNIIMQCQYDPNAYKVLATSFLGVLLTVTVTFPDTTNFAFTGWVDKFTPNNLQEGVFPLAEVRIVAGNQEDDGTTDIPTVDGVNII